MWFLVFFACLFFYNNKYLLPQILKKAAKTSVTFLLVVYVVSGLFIYIPVLYITNGSLPLRAENISCFLYSLILLLIASVFIAGRINDASFITFYKYRYLLFSILIFSSANMKMITDSLLSGYFYKLVMNGRISMFENAKNQNKHEVTLDDYETAVNKKIKAYPAADRQILQDIMTKPLPSYLFWQ